MRSNLFGEVDIGEVDYTIVWKTQNYFDQKNVCIPQKSRTCIKYHIYRYTCSQFDGFTLANELRNAKIGLLTKWSIVRRFYEAESP